MPCTSADSKDKAAETAAQQTAAVTLVKAIGIAEQATGGMSSEAGFDLEDGKAIYEVEVTLANRSHHQIRSIEQVLQHAAQGDLKQRIGPTGMI